MATIRLTTFNRKFTLVDRHCFKVDCLRLVEKHPDNTGGIAGSFHLLSVMNGKVRVSGVRRQDAVLSMGDSVLIPAIVGNYTVEPQEGNASVLKSYLS